MPLDIVSFKSGNKAEKAEAIARIQAAGGINPSWIGGAGMGSFKAVNNTQQETVLATSGAGPCQIIVVHGGRGRGAVGHYAATDNPQEILAGVANMVGAIGHPVDTVVFAAAYGVATTTQGQRAYERTIREGTAQGFGGTTVLYPAQGSDPYDGCIYFPLSEKLVLVADSKAFNVPNFNSTGELGGIRAYSY